ncbi:unnamed protein product [Pararhodospirillum photometricum DSM 122]|uniref:Uncharacterized protein n=1 Tax=Pararhodospirillum photometricum DSM 122 TaxID=1150469 RepID=H6SN93_PARPM|nr:unnamed protein product [Pararhodospirillum photometricum DSM 122]
MDDAQAGVGPQGLGQQEAILVRQTDVDNGDIVRMMIKTLEKIPGSPHTLGLQAVKAQVLHDTVAYVRVILDHQDFNHDSCIPSGCPMGLASRSGKQTSTRVPCAG